MDLQGLEKYLALNRIDFKSITDGILINMGFLIGRVHVKYDRNTNTLSFNDKSRWITQALLGIVMLYFLFSNFDVYSQVQRSSCIGVTIAMFAIFTYKEVKIRSLKNKLLRAN